MDRLWSPVILWLYVSLCRDVEVYLKSNVYSHTAPSCINKRWSSVFRTPEPGDSHVPQLLYARCLIVLFVYLAAPFHFLCCWRWENTQQLGYDSALPPSPFLSSQHLPPPHLFLRHAFPWLSAPSFAFRLIKAFFENKTVKWFTEPQQCQWAALFFQITLRIWLITNLNIKWGPKME